jgi:hypothetical protein
MFVGYDFAVGKHVKEGRFCRKAFQSLREGDLG